MVQEGVQSKHDAGRCNTSKLVTRKHSLACTRSLAPSTGPLLHIPDDALSPGRWADLRGALMSGLEDEVQLCSLCCCIFSTCAAQSTAWADLRGALTSGQEGADTRMCNVVPL